MSHSPQKNLRDDVFDDKERLVRESIEVKVSFLIFSIESALGVARLSQSLLCTPVIISPVFIIFLSSSLLHKVSSGK